MIQTPKVYATLALILALTAGCQERTGAGEARASLPDAEAQMPDADGQTPDTTSEDDAEDDATSEDATARQVEFFDRSVVQNIVIEIAPDDRQAMFDALPERIYVPATFTWNDIRLENVGVRFKGNSSSSPEAWWKRSVLVKFGEYVEGQRFLGLRRVSLDNAVQFGSLFSERLMSDILLAEGVTTSRVNYAQVTINGLFDGLFVNVERIDKSFLESAFGNRDGVLYKNHLGGPGSDLSVLQSKEEYGVSFEPKTHKDEADYSALMELATLVRDTPEADLEATLEARFALDPFLKLMAVMMLSGAFDQYTGFNPHNYYLYDDPATGHIHYLVWDLDVGFADNAFGQVPVIDGWNASWPAPKVPRPLIERILANENLRARYRAHAERILETHFRPERIEAQLDTLFRQAQPVLARDPYPPRRVTNPSDTGYPSIVASMKAFMQRRYATARAQLDNPATERPTTAAEQGPRPGESLPDDPSNLRVTQVDERGVHLAWQDNSDREALTIVQRCEGVECTTFQNRHGVEPDQEPQFIDNAIRPGVTYRYRVYAAWPTPEGPRGTGTSNIAEATP